MNRYATLFSPFTLGGVPLRNRIVMLPMTTGFCERETARWGSGWSRVPVLAANRINKQELEDLVRALSTRAERAGVSIRLGQTVDRRLLEQEAPDVLVVAVGAEPRKPDVPGIDGDNVVLAEQVLTGEAVPSGPVVIVGGGLVGCETAEHLARLAPSAHVTVVEMLDKMAANVPATSRPFLLARLRAERVVLLPGRKVVEVGSGYVTLEGAEETIRVEAGMVVLATGYKPDQGMIAEFLGTVPRTCLIGDCAGGRTIKEAMEAGFAAGRSI